MFLCDALAKVMPSEDILNAVWLLFHLVGLSANLYACWLLKKKWLSLGSFKLLLGTSIFSSVFALVVHLYLPINFMLKDVTGLNWSLGSLPCTVLPPVANFALAASTLSLLAVAMEHYFKTIYQDEISLRDAENTTVLVWAIASLITAPQFCQCGTVSEPFLDEEGNCIQGWQFTSSGRLYEASRLILQYVIPFAVITNLFIKVQIYPLNWKKHLKFRKCLSVLVDILTGILLGISVYFFPVRTAMISAHSPPGGLSFSDIAIASQILDFFAVFICIAAPFEIIEIMNDVDAKTAPHKTAKLTGYELTGQALLAGNNGKLNEKVFKEKPSDEFLRSLVNEEPLRLKNEIIV